MPPRRILHIITDLNIGGAETMLTRPVEAQPSLAERTTVVSLLPAGFLPTGCAPRAEPPAEARRLKRYRGTGAA